jgi:hypothetical protein
MASISDSTLKEDGEDYNQITAGSPNGETASSKRKRDLSDVDGSEILLREISDIDKGDSQTKAGTSQNDETAGKKRKRDLTDVDEEGPPVRIDKGKQPMRDFEAEVDRVLEEEVNSFLDDKYLQKVSTDLEGENKFISTYNDNNIINQINILFRESSSKYKFRRRR